MRKLSFVYLCFAILIAVPVMGQAQEQPGFLLDKSRAINLILFSAFWMIEYPADTIRELAAAYPLSGPGLGEVVNPDQNGDGIVDARDLLLFVQFLKNLPTVRPTPFLTSTPIITPMPTFTETPTPTATSTPTDTPEPTATPTPTVTPTPVVEIVISGVVKSLIGSTPIEGASITIGDITTQSGTAGEYSITLPAGTYKVLVKAAGFQDFFDVGLEFSDSRVFNFSLRPESVPTLTPTPTLIPTITPTPTVTPTPTPLPGSVYGVVYDAEVYDLIVGAVIEIDGMSVETDANGYYRLNVPGGKYTLNILAEGYLGGKQDITMEGSDVENNLALQKEPGFQTIVVNLPDLPEDAKPLEMVLIPPGTFMMGTLEFEEEYAFPRLESVRQEVTIAQPFYVGTYEITQAQWEALMGYNPANLGTGYNYPVHQISRGGYPKFINQLNAMELGTFRLPGEEEWEYACRAGTTTRFYWGDDLDHQDIDNYAWYSGNSKREAHEVGLKLPNPWGLYDMSGNIREINLGGFHDGSSSQPLIRGGSWDDIAKRCRSVSRNYWNWRNAPFSNKDIGLRLIREYP